MTMLFITKELALAVVKYHTDDKGVCAHCGLWSDFESEPIEHKKDCIVHKAKLLLKNEWGIE